MNTHRLLLGSVLALVLGAVPAQAHHVVWLDFSLWDLGAYPTVNGNSPPTPADRSAVQELVVANMVEDYAPFDIYFTTVQPPNGRYTWVVFLPGTFGTLFGCAGPSCCALGFCSGIGTWDEGVSSVEIYTGAFAALNAFSGANANTTRIANGISHTTSHELGHILDLTHCHSADDFVASGTACVNDGYGATADANVNWHMMASGASTGLTGTQRATRDRFFNMHSERRVLYSDLQPRNHWAQLGNVNAGLGRSDLTFGRLLSPTSIEWHNLLSDGTAFGADTTWSAGAGQRADLFFTSDVTGDGRVDLVYGRIAGASTVRWYVRAATNSSFGAATTWVSDAGDAGDIFRLADVTGDGRADLVYGRPLPDGVKWYVRPSTGAAFGDVSVWLDDAGDEAGLFLLGDVTADGTADLVRFDKTRGGAANDNVVTYHSDGASFRFSRLDLVPTSNPDYVLLGDADGDQRADLVTGRVLSNTDVDWYVRPSDCLELFVECFPDGSKWVDGAGDAGDLFRLGDGDGDGRVDLFYGRPIGMTSLINAPDPTQIRWYGRLSTGAAFGAYATWATDAGDEGDMFP